MTFISQYARALKAFLNRLVKDGSVCKFKIYWRTGFLLDVYVVTDKYSIEADLREEFFKNNPLPDSVSKKQMENVRIIFNILDTDELAEEEYFNDINENPNTIDYGPRYRFDSFLDSPEVVVKKRKINIPVITFYSYKGGVGRTTTMISYALHLAKMGKKVAIIDCDLEAPGYLNFFDLSKNPKLIEGEKNGLIEFMCDSQFLGETVEIKDYIFNVGEYDENSADFPELKKIWIVPAGNLNEGAKDTIVSQSRRDYLEGLAKLNFGDPQTVINGFYSLFERLENLHIGAILIDSRTGFNDIFGTTAWHLSSCVVGFFGLSRQTEPGFTNLLAEHSKKGNEGDVFKLILAFSILPENIHKIREEMQDFIDRAYGKKEPPVKCLIHRNALLESIGTGDRDVERKFIDMCITNQREQQFLDYNRLFGTIDNTCFSHEDWNSRNRTKQIYENDLVSCRNIVLQQIEKVVHNAAKPAEDAFIDAQTFFYRDCIGDFFKKEKLVICGRRGTGKTYLCRALQNEAILNKIKDLSKVNDNNDFIFINAFPTSKVGQSLIKESIRHAYLDKDSNMDAFWWICTWAKLLLDDSVGALSEIRSFIKQQSSLSYEKFHVVDEVLETKELFELMNNVDGCLHIVEDLHRFNAELKKLNKKVFVLYDGIHSCVSHTLCDTVIPSLLNYWEKDVESIDNIIPKIFIRTDLLKFSLNNILNLEWSVEEVFGWFFKQVFSDSAANEACWALAKEFCTDSQYISYVKRIFENNDNQFNILSQAEMEPLVQVFFGKSTEKYGSPWDYFRKEISNADYSANLQAFINIFNRNAVKTALATAETNITEIISPTIYTAAEVRQLATRVLLENMAQDSYSNVLLDFQNVVFNAHNDWLRCKSLNDEQFEGLIEITCNHNSSLDYISKDDLISLIFANGIMDMVHTTKGNVYRFAPLYWSSWSLQDEKTEYENIIYLNSWEKAKETGLITDEQLKIWERHRLKPRSSADLAKDISERIRKNNEK